LLVLIDYVVEGGRYKRTWEIDKQWKVDLRLKPLSEKLIELIATEKYLQNLYPIEPPVTIVLRANDGSYVYVSFKGDKPQVRVDMSSRPSIVWFTKQPEEVVKELLS